ncbi:MAG: ORF6N domain-containing protein, partial [bacterium]
MKKEKNNDNEKPLKEFTCKSIIPIERIEKRIFLMRNKRVMIDKDLADLYNVPTKVLNQAVKRNIK